MLFTNRPLGGAHSGHRPQTPELGDAVSLASLRLEGIPLNGCKERLRRTSEDSRTKTRRTIGAQPAAAEVRCSRERLV